MSKTGDAIHTIHYIDYMAGQRKWINQLHPLSKLLITFFYMILVVSYGNYNLWGLAGMILYPVMVSILGEIPILKGIKQMRYMIILVFFIGIANPFLDRQIMVFYGDVYITGGMISFLTLLLKGVFCLVASYILIATTTIEQICYGLRKLHIPKLFVTLVLLIYRYIIVLLKEVERMSQAYQLRAPGQKGIHFKVWGSMVGLLLLRSIDRAQVVYDSMQLRGFDGEFSQWEKIRFSKKSAAYVILWGVVLSLLRYFPVFELIGRSLLY